MPWCADSLTSLSAKELPQLSSFPAHALNIMDVLLPMLPFGQELLKAFWNSRGFGLLSYAAACGSFNVGGLFS